MHTVNIWRCLRFLVARFKMGGSGWSRQLLMSLNWGRSFTTWSNVWGEPRFLFSFSLPNVSQIKEKRRLNTSGVKKPEIIEPFFDVMPGTSLFQVLTVLFVSLWSLNADKMRAHVTVFQNKMSQKIKVARALSKASGNSQFYLQIHRFWLFQLTRVV